ncbi:MAG: hypothetical protein LBR12_04060 [Opitutaceae bacterium]|jgi:hypothetical protein|nr:hypothetical protein [Opitutaceae bacterium]
MKKSAQGRKPAAKKTTATKATPLAKAVTAKKAGAATAPVPAKPAATVITANIDIGFGNTLHIRGQGSGLSWDVGLPLECIADDLWSVTLPETDGPVAYKLLVNDLSWSTGPDYIANPGENIVVKPVF